MADSKRHRKGVAKPRPATKPVKTRTKGVQTKKGPQNRSKTVWGTLTIP